MAALLDCRVALAMTEFRLLKLFLPAALALAASAAAATPPLMPPTPMAPPRLLIVISVDQFSADLFDEYRPQFTGGLARLASGTVFRNGYQSHAATETCPGHSTILTGRRPSATGIVGNLWIDQSANRSDKTIYCAEDERAPGTSAADYKVSPVHLLVPTLGQLLKQPSPASLNVAVAGKDRSAVMMGGHAPDQRWYWDGKRFATDLSKPAPASVVAINAAAATMLAVPRPPLVPPPVCAAKAQPVRLEGSGRVIGAGALARAAGDAAHFRAGPEADGTVLALSAALIREIGLGQDNAPDVLSIGLSATDYVGHFFGTGGQEMCLQLLALDRELGDFLARLDQWNLDYAVALTADHGGDDAPERLRLRGIASAARVDPALETARVAKTIGHPGALLGPQSQGNFIGDVYVDAGLASDERARLLAKALDFYRRHPQVAAAYSRAELSGAPAPTTTADKWSLMDMARASFDPRRSGDIFVMLKPHVNPIVDTSIYASTHGSPWPYDRRVPIIFWRPEMDAATREESVETVDIMPTLAAMLRLPNAASGIDGKCLHGIQGIDCDR